MSKEKKLSREEVAKIEIGHTKIKKVQAVVTVVIFLVFISVYLVCQLIYDAKKQGVARMHSLQLVPLLTKSGPDKITGAIKAYENDLEDNSLLRMHLLSPAQEFMLDALGNGNEKAWLGKDGYLFYVSGVNYLANPGFLLPEKLYKRGLSGIQPNPVKAIVDFKRQLAARGIELVIMPTTVKPMLYSDKLSGKEIVLLQNPSYGKFLNAMEQHKVTVFDPAPALLDLRKRGIEPFLKTDTHWSTEGMDLTAKLLAEKLGGKPMTAKLPETEVKALGDIALMLKLKYPELKFPPESARLKRFDHARDEKSDILLMGDSFCNIYSMKAMNWGENSGFAERFSYYLGRPIDVIARNDAGAYATRFLLHSELKKGNDRLSGKKVVIWQFAIRELADGDWKMLDMSLGKAADGAFSLSSGKVTVKAKIIAKSEVPRSNQAPYKDHVMSIHIGNINGNSAGQAVVYLVSMEDNVLTNAAKLNPGDEVTLELSPWRDAEKEFGSWSRSELDDEKLLEFEPCWGKLLSR